MFSCVNFVLIFFEYLLDGHQAFTIVDWVEEEELLCSIASTKPVLERVKRADKKSFLKFFIITSKVI
jgi:hypothetical protein